jgi:hypothetical protein
MATEHLDLTYLMQGETGKELHVRVKPNAPFSVESSCGNRLTAGAAQLHARRPAPAAPARAAHPRDGDRGGLHAVGRLPAIGEARARGRDAARRARGAPAPADRRRARARGARRRGHRAAGPGRARAGRGGATRSPAVSGSRRSRRRLRASCCRCSGACRRSLRGCASVAPPLTAGIEGGGSGCRGGSPGGSRARLSARTRMSWSSRQSPGDVHVDHDAPGRVS